MAVGLDAEIVIVGAGFGGLGMAIELKRRGIESFLVLERGDDVGGTWRDNVYPGCACDIPSVLYSYSFEPNREWTRTYPQQDELWAYLKRCSLKYAIQPHIRFGTELSQARYDEGSTTWELTTAGGRTLSCRALIVAMGPLSRPRVPNLPGRERFTGTVFHSSQWDSSVDLRDKRAAIVGTGASAIQIVPAIAPVVRRLTLFQRTPAWVIPRGDAPLPPWRRALHRRMPGFTRALRSAIYWMLEMRAIGFTIRPDLMQLPEKLARLHLARQIPDPELRRRLTPGYRMGCKRVLISDDYYPALLRGNVEVATDPIERFNEDSIVTADGTRRAFDVVIFATGFRATDGVTPVRIYGRDGAELNDTWRERMQAYLGTSVAGFPNLFTIVGPNTGLGHNSMIVMMEAQYRYVLDALRLMRRRGIRALDVRRDVQQRYNERLQARMAKTVWSSGCSSWYLDAAGKNTTLWPGFTFVFRMLTRRVRPESYDLT